MDRVIRLQKSQAQASGTDRSTAQRTDQDQDQAREKPKSCTGSRTVSSGQLRDQTPGPDQEPDQDPEKDRGPRQNSWTSARQNKIV